MEDIAPALLEALQAAFRRILAGDDASATLLQKLTDSGSYEDAGHYAERVGLALAQALAQTISSNLLPDGRMYWNIAERVLRPMLEQNHELATSAAMAAQEALNQQAGIGLKALGAALNRDRVRGILNQAANAERYDDIAPQLHEEVVNFTQASVDATLQRNAEFQSGAGLAPQIVRRVSGSCCDWCEKLAGTYAYPDEVPKDVYRRHRFCRCVVEYVPRKGGRAQNVHTRKWTSGNTKRIMQMQKRQLLKGRNAAYYGAPVSPSLGAKSRSYPDVSNPITGEKFQFVIGSRPEYPKDHLLAGKGSKKAIRKVDELVSLYGGTPSEWKHEKAFYEVYDEVGDIRQISVHWFEATGCGRCEEFVKLYDGMMYRDEYEAI